MTVSLTRKRFHFSGEVKLAKLHVTDELMVDPSSNFPVPEFKPLQIYYDVIIEGNLKLKVLDLKKKAKIFLEGEEINLSNISETFWTKSSNQEIRSDITFKNSLTIDQLRVKYLNGFPEEDFLYTTVTKIPEKFTNLHFENVDVDDKFFVDGGDDPFFNVAPESLTIRERLHLKNLRGKMMMANTFNGIFVPYLLNGTKQLRFPENMDFSAIRARRVNVDELNFLFLNDEDSDTFLKNARSVHQDQKSDFVKTPEFRVDNLIVERINDLEVKKLDSLKDIEVSDFKDLMIIGDLTVTGDFRVQKIGDLSPEIYLENMANENIVFDTEKNIDELIVQNATFRFLNDRDANKLFDSLLSKSRNQLVPGRFSFYKIVTDNVAAKCINDQDTSKLQWIDEPLFFDGNVTFQDLIVKSVITETLNGRDVNGVRYKINYRSRK